MSVLDSDINKHWKKNYRVNLTLSFTDVLHLLHISKNDPFWDDDVVEEMLSKLGLIE